MAGNVGVGAEFMVHSFSGGGQTFIAKDYLVVEVALFPAKGDLLIVNPDQFRLRLNHKQVLAPEGAQFVGSSLDSGFMGSQNGPQFPGDPASREQRIGPDGQPLPSPDRLAVQIALPETQTRKPVSGFLYFPHRGKIGKIHSLELGYAGPAGKATLALE